MMDAAETLKLTKVYESGAANTFRITEAPPVFVRGKGAALFTADGRRFLDFVAGSSVSALGHAHPAHYAALARASEGGIFHTGTRLPSPFRAELYEKLAGLMPREIDCFQLVNSGAEAIEAAIKAAQFVTGRHGLVAFEGGYHGRTLGALSVTHGARIRDPFPVRTDLVRFVPWPQVDNVTVHGDISRVMEELKPAALLVEAVQGVSGVRLPPAGFLKELRDLCTQHSCLMIVDEIWNGFGRCGAWFGFEREAVVPDLIVMGKALSAALPLSCVAGHSGILKAWPPGMHTSTFQGNPLACAMASAVIDTIRDENLLGHVKNVIEPAFKDLSTRLADAKAVSSVRVCGAQAAIVLKNPCRSVAVQQAGLERGLLLYGGGVNGECLMLVPPLVMTAEELTEGLEAVVLLVTSLSV